FSSRRRHTRFSRDWSSDVCSSDLLSGETMWCQGYSEPGAGSDLASLTTSARREGDYYIVNGSKIWTSHGHYADMMFALVRTSKEGKKQEGITCLLIDMKSEGLEIRPLIKLDGRHKFNQRSEEHTS